MIHVIQKSVIRDHNIRRAEITWQTQSICAFIASTVEDNSAREKMFANAQKLTLLEDELDDTTTSGDSDERSLEDIIENGNVQAALARNNARVGPGIASMRMTAKN